MLDGGNRQYNMYVVEISNDLIMTSTNLHSSRGDRVAFIIHGVADDKSQRSFVQF